MYTDIGELVSSFVGGMITAIPAVSEEEWRVHTHMMHVADPAKRKAWNRKQSEAHHDDHHDAYDPNGFLAGPSNDAAVDKFGPIEGAKVLVGNAVLGSLLSEPAHVLMNGPTYQYNPLKHVAFTAGFFATAATYYVAYETLHHAMHFWEERRDRIVRTLTQRLQGTPDGELLFKMPFLEHICNSIANNTDQNIKKNKAYSYSQTDFDTCDAIIDFNRERNKKHPVMRTITAKDLLQEVTELHIAEERERRAKLGFFGKIKDATSRKAMSYLRNSDWFQWILRHHFVHHVNYKKNMNVVLPLADLLHGTLEDSSAERLNATEHTAFMICPYSPKITKYSKTQPAEKTAQYQANPA